MKRLLVPFALAAAVAALGQNGLQVGNSTYSLEEAKAVCVGLKDVNWSPSGKALIYDSVDADGYFQGAYRTSDGVGKALYRIAEGSSIHSLHFLPKEPVGIEVFSKKDEAAKKVRWWIVALDSRNMKAEELMSWEFDEGREVSIDVKVSPTLDHALVDVRAGDEEHHYVLLSGGGRVVLSSDIDQATRQGSHFTGWSSQGTAYFSTPNEGAQQGQQMQILGSKLLNANNGTIELTLSLSGGDGKNVLTDLPLLGKFFLSSPTAPGAGTPVFEVMPWNGGLRPIRSMGPYVKPEKALPPITALGQQAQVTSGPRLGQSGALWLMQEQEAKQLANPRGLLIAPNAGQSWFSDSREWIAYEENGALFVRRIVTQK